MINHTEQNKRVRKTFEELEDEYNNFKKNMTYENRNKLKAKIKEHRESITNFNASINNIFFKK